jgi:hypothetical protein
LRLWNSQAGYIDHVYSGLDILFEDSWISFRWIVLESQEAVAMALSLVLRAIGIIRFHVCDSIMNGNRLVGVDMDHGKEVEGIS